VLLILISLVPVLPLPPADTPPSTQATFYPPFSLVTPFQALPVFLVMVLCGQARFAPPFVFFPLPWIKLYVPFSPPFPPFHPLQTQMKKILDIAFICPKGTVCSLGTVLVGPCHSKTCCLTLFSAPPLSDCQRPYFDSSTRIGRTCSSAGPPGRVVLSG